MDNFLTSEQRLQLTIARVPDGRWPEASPNDGWTYKDLLAHLATGDWIRQHFLRSLLEKGSVPESPDADAGNAERVLARRGKSVSDLMEERAQHRSETIGLVGQFRPERREAPTDMPWFDVRARRSGCTFRAVRGTTSTTRKS